MVNTVTSYRSPVRLVKHASEEVTAYSSVAISRARKRLMAEIMLVGDEIVIDDVAYSRNDASTLLDVITEENWKTHNIIYSQKGLLNFLEKEEFNDEELKKADAWLYNERFVQAVSPYFSHSFNTVSGRLIRQDNFVELTKLLNYQGYILPDHSHEGYQKIRNYLDELNYTLRNLSWEKFFADESILHFIFSDEWKRFLNKLPSSFTSLRDELVEQMINIALRFQHKATWYYLHQVLVQLKSIETNDFNRSEVERIDAIIYENSRIESRKGSAKAPKNDGEVSTGRIIWWAIWVILIIVRAATCNDRTSKTNNYDYESFRQYQQTESKKTKLVDERRNNELLRHYLDSLGSKPSLDILQQQRPKTGDLVLGVFADEFKKNGSDTVHITNNTSYDCVALYIKPDGRLGSVYEGALPNIAAAYVRKGERFSFKYTPDGGKLHFIFGETWGKLSAQTEMSIYSERGYSNDSGRRHIVFVYEFFSSKNPPKQNYLTQSISLEDASGYSDRKESKYNYLNNPYDAAIDQATEMNLKEMNGRFAVEAKGSLLVKEEKQTDE